MIPSICTARLSQKPRIGYSRSVAVTLFSASSTNNPLTCQCYFAHFIKIKYSPFLKVSSFSKHFVFKPDKHLHSVKYCIPALPLGRPPLHASKRRWRHQQKCRKGLFSFILTSIGVAESCKKSKSAAVFLCVATWHPKRAGWLSQHCKKEMHLAVQRMLCVNIVQQTPNWWLRRMQAERGTYNLLRN